MPSLWLTSQLFSPTSKHLLNICRVSWFYSQQVIIGNLFLEQGCDILYIHMCLLPACDSVMHKAPRFFTKWESVRLYLYHPASHGDKGVFGNFLCPSVWQSSPQLPLVHALWCAVKTTVMFLPWPANSYACYACLPCQAFQDLEPCLMAVIGISHQGKCHASSSYWKTKCPCSKGIQMVKPETSRWQMQLCFQRKKFP